MTLAIVLLCSGAGLVGCTSSVSKPDAGAPWGPSACYGQKDAAPTSNRRYSPQESKGLLAFSVLSVDGAWLPPLDTMATVLPSEGSTLRFEMDEPTGQAPTRIARFDNDGGRPLVNIEGLRVRLKQMVRLIPGAPVDATPGRAVAVRNSAGELLFATVKGGMRELFDELHPEVRLRKGSPIGRPHAFGCLSVQGSDDYQPHELIVETDVESKTVGPGEMVAVAVGCVEYLLKVGLFEERLTDNCIGRGDLVVLAMLRRSLLVDPRWPDSTPP